LFPISLFHLLQIRTCNFILRNATACVSTLSRSPPPPPFSPSSTCNEFFPLSACGVVNNIKRTSCSCFCWIDYRALVHSLLKIRLKVSPFVLRPTKLANGCHFIRPPYTASLLMLVLYWSLLVYYRTYAHNLHSY
jgi:hypothetical protein